jgi:hypothetical protein
MRIDVDYWAEIEFNLSGTFSKRYPATHTDPAEGGLEEYTLLSITIRNRVIPVDAHGSISADAICAALETEFTEALAEAEGEVE